MQAQKFIDGYNCYFAGGARGDCRYALFSVEYNEWHDGFTLAEMEDM